MAARKRITRKRGTARGKKKTSGSARRKVVRKKAARKKVARRKKSTAKKATRKRATRKKAVRKKTARRKTARKKTTRRKKSAIQRFDEALPPDLRAYSKRVRSGLSKLEREIEKSQRDARRRWTRLLRDASHQLGKIE